MVGMKASPASSCFKPLSADRSSPPARGGRKRVNPAASSGGSTGPETRARRIAKTCDRLRNTVPELHPTASTACKPPPRSTPIRSPFPTPSPAPTGNRRHQADLRRRESLNTEGSPRDPVGLPTAMPSHARHEGDDGLPAGVGGDGVAVARAHYMGHLQSSISGKGVSPATPQQAEVIPAVPV